MQTALSSPQRRAREAADLRRSSRPRRGTAQRPTTSRARRDDHRGGAVRRRFVAACVAVYAVMLAVAIVALIAGREVSGTPAVVLPLVATYLASSAWLAATVVLLRGARGPAINAWAGGGAALLVASFVAQVVVARGG